MVMSRALASNSENFYFSPDSILNFRKRYQIWGKLAQEQKSYRPKTNWGMWKHPPPPSAYRVKPKKIPIWIQFNQKKVISYKKTDLLILVKSIPNGHMHS